MVKTEFRCNRLGMVSVLCALAVQPLMATTYYVKTNGVDGVNDGQSWGAAFATISNAVAHTTGASDIVIVSNGTYNITADIVVTNGITVASQNGAAVTTVNAGNVTGRRCFTVTNATATATIRGFTITGGLNPTVVTVSAAGGGVFAHNGRILDCIIRNNTCTSGGNNWSGGGLFVRYSMVSNCVILSNSGAYGGGVKVHTDSLITHCTIASNSVTFRGGGADLQFSGTAGLIRNCLVFGNTSPAGAGKGAPGIVLLGAGAIENCTVTRNTGGGIGDEFPAAIGATVGRRIVNTIMYGNTYTVGSPNSVSNFNSSGAMPAVTNCILEFTWTNGVGNVTNNPIFRNVATNDFRLLTGSPAIDSGFALPWITAPGSTDLDGNPRLYNGTVDRGAYEYSPSATLSCTIIASPLSGLAPLNVNLSATVDGSSTNNLYYKWAFTNAAVIDVQGTNQQATAHTYAAGTHTVTLTVTNSIGEVAQDTETIKAGQPVAYVARGGNSDQAPYASWATAASNIQSAVDACVDGSLIMVSNATYAITATITVPDAITIEGVFGAAQTIVSKTGAGRCFTVTDSGAVLDGLTIKGGSASEGIGGGVYLPVGGTVRNCTVTQNATVGGGGLDGGGGIWIQGGLVSNCVISLNSANYGGGIKMHLGVVVDRCVIASNTAAQRGGGADLQHATGGFLRNSLIYGNSCNAASGVILLGNTSGSMENCTVTRNTSTGTDTNYPCAIGASDGRSIINTIMYGNTYTVSQPTTFGGFTPAITNSCLEFAWAAGTNNIAADPQFVNPAALDFNLPSTSPCADRGLDLFWTATSIDLAGNPRRSGARVDMGAYEYQRPLGTMLTFR